MHGCLVAVQATVAAEKAEDGRRDAEGRCAMASERAKAAQARVTQQLSIVSSSREQRAAAEATATEAEARADSIARRLIVAEAAAADARMRAQVAVDSRERLVDEASAAQDEAWQQRQRVWSALLRAAQLCQVLPDCFAHVAFGENIRRSQDCFAAASVADARMRLATFSCMLELL